MLKTRSIQEKIKKTDGIRVCIMRRPGVFNDKHFDIWVPALAPSHILLDNYKLKKINWEDYEKQYTVQVLLSQKKIINFFISMALMETVTFVCWEESPGFCHRRLLAEHIKKMKPQLKIYIR